MTNAQREIQKHRRAMARFGREIILIRRRVQAEKACETPRPPTARDKRAARAKARREKVIELRQQGMSTIDIARRIGVTRSTVYKLGR